MREWHVQILWGLRKLTKARVPYSVGDHSYSFRSSMLASKALSLFLMIAKYCFSLCPSKDLCSFHADRVTAAAFIDRAVNTNGPILSYNVILRGDVFFTSVFFLSLPCKHKVFLVGRRTSTHFSKATYPHV